MGFLLGLGRGPVVSETGEFETSFAGGFVEVGHRASGDSQSKSNMINTTEEVLSLGANRRRSTTVTATRTPKSTPTDSKKSLKVDRVFSDPKTNPFDQLEWERRTAEITDDAGKVIFKQENVEVPKSW